MSRESREIVDTGFVKFFKRNGERSKHGVHIG